jgi:hypothetical protein
MADIRGRMFAMATTKKGKRQTVSSSVRALACYPKMGSPKAATAEFVNFVLDAKNAQLLSKALSDSVAGARQVTVRCSRRPAKISGLLSVTVTFAGQDAV